MWIAQIIALSLAAHAPAWSAMRYYNHDGWRLTVNKDRFSGQVGCAIARPDVRLIRDTLIFRMGKNAETIDAHFRVDSGPVLSLREVLAADQARGFFPHRGWVEDPSGSEVAIPSSYAASARYIWIRANERSRPKRFTVAGLREIVRRAIERGCTVQPL